MMESLLALIVIGIPLLMIAGFVIGIVALRRTRRLLDRIEGLENRVIELETAPAPSGNIPVEEEPAPFDHAQEKGDPAGRMTEDDDSWYDAVSASYETNPVDEYFEPPPASTTMPPIPEGSASEHVSPSEPPDSGKTGPSIDWEQWIGVRGAAAAGGIVLALAALLFFQYSIEHGLISPTMRVILGVAVGLGCMIGSEWLIKRDQASAANALTGAGVVILYGATWAAQNLYHLIGFAPAAVLMIAITAVCVTIAVARNSIFIAVLGLFGGFATPLLVSTDPAGPAALFGYILLLDLGLLWLARTRGWPLLAVLSLAGTALHQGLWILGSMDAERTALGLIILGVFALAFLFVGNGDRDRGMLWRATRAGGVAIPFAFGLHFAGTARLSPDPLPLGAMLILLTAGACWLSRKGIPGASIGAAGASLGVMTVWTINHRLHTEAAWRLVAVSIAIAAVFFVFSLIEGNGSRPKTALHAALVADLGFLTLLTFAAVAPEIHHPWPWSVAWTVLGAFLVVHSRAIERAWIGLAAGLLPSLGLTLFILLHGDHTDSLPAWGLAALTLCLALVFQTLGMGTRPDRARIWADRTAAATAVALMPAAAVFSAFERTDAPLSLGLILILGMLTLLAATRLRSGVWFFTAALSTAFWQTIAYAAAYGFSTSDGQVALPLALLAAGAAVFTFWPVLTPRTWVDRNGAWRGASLAGPLWFLVLRDAWDTQWGSDMIAIVPLALAAAALAAIWRIRPALSRDADSRFRAIVWYCAVALSLVSLAIPLQLDREWITIGWALNGLAVIGLWTRLDHPGLKYFGLALLGAATVRLIANPAVLGYHVRSGTPILNWLSYTYLVPAAAMVLSMVWLKRHEVERARTWERWYGTGRMIGAGACGLAAVATVFVWLNLTIADLFTGGTRIVLSFRRLPARDATTSVAWAVYALILLGLGVRSKSSSLRWLSLGLLVATILKVFLHDLGELEDLYRVGSLVGLAVSLIVVSLIYQRFVFRKGVE